VLLANNQPIDSNWSAFSNRWALAAYEKNGATLPADQRAAILAVACAASPQVAPDCSSNSIESASQGLSSLTKWLKDQKGGF
jgi:hypothetical protein